MANRIICAGQDASNLYNLNWNLPNSSLSSYEISDISPEQIVFHPDLHSPSDLWNVEYIRGIQLIVSDPVATRNNGEYVCRGIPNKADEVQEENSNLLAKVHVNVLSGEYCLLLKRNLKTNYTRIKMYE